MEVMNMDSNTPAPVFCISLQLRLPGVRKKVATEAEGVQIEADADMMHVSKDILQSEAYDKLKKLDADIRALVKKRTAGNSYLRHGIYLVNAAALDSLVDYLKTRKAVRDAAARDFVFNFYEKAKADAKESLGPLFDESDYPPAEELYQAFDLSWKVFSFPSVDALKELSPSVWKEESEKVKSLWAEALEASQQLLRAEVLSFTDKMAEMLTPTPDGKKKSFHKSTVDKLQDFLATFDTRQIANDGELRELVAKMRATLAGVDTAKLKSNAALRDAVKRDMDEARESLSKLVKVAGKRQYSLDDEDEGSDAPSSPVQEFASV
jgi:hypothetical protein